MKSHQRAIAALLALAVAVLACAEGTTTPGPADRATPAGTRARVVSVVDGDTIWVEIDGEPFRVRYIGIDAPETGESGGPREWMSGEATETNRRLVDGRRVTLAKDVSETDRYGRLLRYVYLADGTFVNAELVRLGYATSVTFPPDVSEQPLLQEMERQAREARRGLWGATPRPP